MKLTFVPATITVSFILAACHRSTPSKEPQSSPSPAGTIVAAKPAGAPVTKLIGVLSMEMTMGDSLNADGSLSVGGYLKRLKTKDGDYQVITSADITSSKSDTAKKKDTLEKKIASLKERLAKAQKSAAGELFDANAKANAEMEAVVLSNALEENEQSLRNLQSTIGAQTGSAEEAPKTEYKGLEVSDRGVRWLLGKRYAITGTLPATHEPSQRLDGVKGVMEATLVELLGDAEASAESRNGGAAKSTVLAWPVPNDLPLDHSWEEQLSIKFGSIAPADKFTFQSGRQRLVDDNTQKWEPNPEDPGKASGRILTAVGTHHATATCLKAGFAFSDAGLKHPRMSGPVFTEGQMIVPWLFDLGDVPDVYVDNSFSVQLIGSKWTLITLDKEKGDRLIIPVGRSGLGTISDAWCWPGTKVRINGHVLERKKDGWYENGKKISP